MIPVETRLCRFSLFVCVGGIFFIDTYLDYACFVILCADDFSVTILYMYLILCFERLQCQLDFNTAGIMGRQDKTAARDSWFAFLPMQAHI